MSERVPDTELKGHGFERANVCSGCREQLRNPRDGHYHTREALAGGVAAICCLCACVSKADDAGQARPEAPPLPEADQELLERVLAVVDASGATHFKVGDVWKVLGAESDALWYSIKGLLQTSDRFEQVSKQCWKVRI